MFDFLREKKTDTDGQVWIINEMTTNLEGSNRQFAMVQMQLRRIEEKLFTKEENTEFFMHDIMEMLKKSHGL